MRLLILMAVFGTLEALHCDKEFNYYDLYGNGFDVNCQGITEEHIHLLLNITIFNEISLRIDNSTLTNVSSKVFHNVDNIRYLYLDNSTFTFDRTCPVFEMLGKLEHLIIRNTPFFVNKFTFAGLTNLKHLVLNNNNLEEMEKGSLQNLPSLNHLQITNNKIMDLKNLPLCELRKLKDLNLSKNAISSLKNVYFYCRKATRSAEFNLNDQNHLLNSQKRDYFSISDVSFKLINLDLSYNNISKLEDALVDLRNLRTLNLEGNNLIMLEYKELSSLENLEKAHLKNNSIESIEEKVFSDQKNLEYLDLSNNRLIDFSINNTPMLEYVNLANNMLNKFSVNNFNNKSSLKILILSNNRIVEIPRNAFRNHATLKALDLADNSIKLSNFTFSGLFQLEDLSIANNNIIEIPPLLFQNLTNLKMLDLSRNKIKYFSFNNTFKDLINVETLNISYNLLRELNYALVEPLKNLNVLDIAGNQLHYVEYDLIISGLPLLSVLNIKLNLLSCELLYKIIKFLKKRSISYTINEDFDFEQENVAGIYCNNEKNIVSDSLKNESMSTGSYTLLVLGVILGLVLVFIIIGVSIFKIHIFLKRRKYKADEFELIDE